MIRPPSHARLVVDLVASLALFGALTSISFAFYAPGALSTTIPEVVAVVALIVSSILQFGGLAVGRIAPGVALAAAWAGAIVQMAAGLQPLPINLAILGVLFATAAWGSRRIMWAGLASAAGGGVVAVVYMILVHGLFLGTEGLASLTATILVFVVVVMLALIAPWMGGFGWRMVLRWRASREAQSLAELAAAEEQERVAIARDMHDVVAHSLAVIIAQSDGARYAAASDPAIAVDTLGTVSETARAALSDVRMLLTQLRHRQGDGPQPMLADLEQVYAQVRQSGRDLRVTVDPTPQSEPPAAIQLAVYRILQEALTNAIRHGAGDTVDVSLAWLPERVEFAVRNPVGPGDAGGSGHGLIGMRERAQLVGGTVTAESGEEEFVVRGMLPIGDAE
ncbi:sensor histidine kinase [uncultured Microbacterium sp.]|uniref:sensor histidine kinase n=1 Tax=uncultured Microbacterium sp. TaxID=191216 RepID=UPI00261D5741|nr:histidine kinase [uncultured Microbacterium sp.]